MSRHVERKKRDAHGKTRPRSTDRAIYIGLIMIGAFVVGLGFPLTSGRYWREMGWAYLALMALLINVYAFRAYLGAELAPFQKSLARLPLRCVGYGTRGGKPIEAAHNQPDARRALAGSLALSLLILGVLAALIIPRHL
jgi:hypothetical protein